MVMTYTGILKDPVLLIKARKEQDSSFKILPKVVSKSKLVFLVPLDSIATTNLYYDIYVEHLAENNELNQIRVRNISRIQRRKINLLNLKRQTINHSDGKYIVTEYFAVGGYLSLQIREKDQYDSFKYRLKEIVACLLVPFTYWYYKDAKLVYEKFSNYARDNSFYYFAYVQQHEKNNKLFYIINQDSPDLANVQPYQNRVVYFMSVKHLLLVLVSKYFIASESKGHAYAWRHNQSVVRYMLNRKPFVFLQHGVLGLKQVDHTFFANNRLNHADLFITSSELEKKIVLNYLGYEPENVAITGLARWDNYQLAPKEKKILVMPTWRVQLELLSDEEFLKSEFYQAYYDLLHSTRIKKILHDNGYQLNFMMHPKFVRYEKYFNSDDSSIQVLHQSDVPLDQELKTSEVIVTDYSSIMWDALYYGGQALLFQFDQAEYLETQGSYLDFQTDLSQIVVKDSQTLLDRIEVLLHGQQKVELASYQQRYFAYSDQNNSQRINDSITEWENRFNFVPLYKKHIVSRK